MKLNVDHSKENIGSALGISPERESELEQIFFEVVTKVSETSDVTASRIIKGISELEITPEEFTYMILQLGFIEAKYSQQEME